MMSSQVSQSYKLNTHFPKLSVCLLNNGYMITKQCQLQPSAISASLLSIFSSLASMVCLLVVHSPFLYSFLVQPSAISVLMLFFFSSLVALMVVVFLPFVMVVYSSFPFLMLIDSSFPFLMLIHSPFLFPTLPFHEVNNRLLFLSVRKYKC